MCRENVQRTNVVQEEEHGGSSDIGRLEDNASATSDQVPDRPQQLKNGTDEHRNDRGRVCTAVPVLMDLDDLDDVDDHLAFSVGPVIELILELTAE